jgi:hypothetical protein
MGLFTFLKNLIGKKEIPKQRVSIEPVSAYTPKGGDVAYRLIDPRYPRGLLLRLERAVLTNPDLSHAHQVFLDLVNTDVKIFVEPTDDNKKAEVETFLGRIGIDNLKRQLFNQLILYGAISVEIVPNEELSEVEKIARVPVPTIWFAYNEDEDRWEPYQWIAGNRIKLNPYTYIYKPLLTLDGSPYGIPPFLAALTIIDTQEDVILELRNLAKKLGLLGFIDISIPLPPQLPGETDTEYRKRLQELLQQEAANINNQIQNGVIVHYDSTNVSHKDISTSDLGKGIIDQIELWLISGAKLQPSILGRSTGQTETWATVAYTQFVRQLKNMQQLVADFLEYLIGFHLTLRSIEFEKISVDFEDPPELNPKLNEEAKLTRAQRVISLYQAGLITEEEARKELGYDLKAVDTGEEDRENSQIPTEWF